jgi:hypothetical protein
MSHPIDGLIVQEPEVRSRDVPLLVGYGGWFDRNKPTLSKREASETPVAFAQWLIDLARHSRGDRTANPLRPGHEAKEKA